MSKVIRQINKAFDRARQDWPKVDPMFRLRFKKKLIGENELLEYYADLGLRRGEWYERYMEPRR